MTEELLGVLVYLRRTVIAHLVEVHGEFRSVQRTPLAQIPAWGNDVKPGF
jgi:hypothetical protein